MLNDRVPVIVLVRLMDTSYSREKALALGIGAVDHA